LLAFSAKPRTLRLKSEPLLRLPADVTLVAKLAPSWLFGAGGSGARFVVAGSTGVRMMLNANTGWFHLEGGRQPASLDVHHDGDDGTSLTIIGNTASLRFNARSIDDLVGAADALLHGLPAILATRMDFPCTVESIVGSTDTVSFGYEVSELRFRVPLVNEGDFRRSVEHALRQLRILGQDDQARLLGASIYFYRARRLVNAGHTPYEFMAEAVLNLAKCLEALFPPEGDDRTRDATRRGLQLVGRTATDIETWFLPALALRSTLDVAHVRLALLGREDIELLTEYVEHAVEHFQKLLQYLFDELEAGRSPIPAYTREALDKSAATALARLRDQLRAAVPQTGPREV
jgi:hypothetical protein